MTGHFEKGAWVEDAPKMQYSEVVGIAAEDLKPGKPVYWNLTTGLVYNSKPESHFICEICRKYITNFNDHYVVTDNNCIKHYCHSGACFEIARLKFSPEKDLCSCNNERGSRVVKLKLEVDDHELRESINRLKVYTVLVRKMKKELGPIGRFVFWVKEMIR